MAPGRGRKVDLFYKWRASLKPIRDFSRRHAEAKSRPPAFMGYIRKTWLMSGSSPGSSRAASAVDSLGVLTDTYAWFPRQLKKMTS